MNDTPEREENWELQLREIASHIAYPPTPDIAGQVYGTLNPPRQARATRLILRFGTMAAVLACSLLVVPDIRAQVLDMLRLGDSAVQIEEINPTPQAVANPDALLQVPESTVPHLSILDFPGEVTTSLVEVRASFPYPVRVPTYPAKLGQPDVVYMLKMGHPYVILGWLNENGSDLALSLHMVNSDSYVVKQFPRDYKEDAIVQTLVNEREAYWLTMPHAVEVYANNSGLLDRYAWEVVNHVLVWTDGPLTYRLETYVALDEAIRIAESLQ